MDNFNILLKRFKSMKNFYLDKKDITPELLLKKYENLETIFENEIVIQKLKQICIIKLNGGLGTTMGCTGPKSLIQVKNKMTFLDITIEQILNIERKYKVKVPLILMNSFYTNNETKEVLDNYKNSGIIIHSFNQNCYPRIFKDNFNLVNVDSDPQTNPDCWYPPGHGDLLLCLKNNQDNITNILKNYGIKYAFISNIDNLGATIDLKILNDIMDNNIDFAMELTKKTKNDIKGGTLIEYQGKSKLYEIAQCNPKDLDEFRSLKKYANFNTNNIWIKLDSILTIDNLLENVDIIVNYKKLKTGRECIQLEYAIGSTISFFNRIMNYLVPRSRFIPVKTTSDLFLVQSNIYDLMEGELVVNKDRYLPDLPIIKLGPNLSTVQEFSKKIKVLPNILELDNLTISGEVIFGSDITLRGNVIIIAENGNSITLPNKSDLENKVISGNLNILDQ